MKNKYFLLLAIAFLGTTLFAQDATGDTKWALTGVAEGSFLEATSWSDGLPNAAMTGKAKFVDVNAADCFLDDSAWCGQVLWGDGAAGGLFTIRDGGVLTTVHPTAWSTVGYNTGGEFIIEAGGTFISAHRFHLGLVEPKEASTVIMEVAGTLITGNKLTVNDPGHADWDAQVYVTLGGEIHAPWLYIGTGGLVDVSGGTIILEDDQTDALAPYVTAGQLTAEGGDEEATITVKITDPDTPEADTTTWITSSTTVGIAPGRTAARATLGVYPNPANDVVYFTENVVANVEIFSINGQLVLRKEQVSQVNVEGLKPGYYVLKAQADNKLYTEKLVIK